MNVEFEDVSISTEEGAWQAVVSRCAQSWPTVKRKARDGSDIEVNVPYEEFLGSLHEDDALVCALGKMNYQVQNGGFKQWIDNGYFPTVDTVREALRRIDGPVSNEVLEILDEVEEVNESASRAIDQLAKVSRYPEYDALEARADEITEFLNEKMDEELGPLDERYYKLDQLLQHEVEEWIMSWAPRDEPEKPQGPLSIVLSQCPWTLIAPDSVLHGRQCRLEDQHEGGHDPSL